MLAMSEIGNICKTSNRWFSTIKVIDNLTTEVTCNNIQVNIS